MQIMKTKFKKISTSLILAATISMNVHGQTTKLVYGSNHTSLGNANVSVADHHATISNIGATGNDGVLIDFNATTHQKALFHQKN